MNLARLRVVAITDRRLMRPDSIARALDGVPEGSVAIQVRDKDLDGGALLAIARVAVQSGAPVFVNDRIDVALAAGAAGVHLPERGMSVADARAIAPKLVVGVSRHGLDASSDGADLIQLGPIWESPGKGDPVGVVALTRLAARAPFVVAVGGIDTLARAREAVEAGARAVAMIRAAWTGQSLAPVVAEIDAALLTRR
jgi:thiamine-phosphate pyrophosphorylase